MRTTEEIKADLRRATSATAQQDMIIEILLNIREILIEATK
jgi:hypothetical protein